MVTEFEDHDLWYPGSHNSSTSYITDRWVISLCRVRVWIFGFASGAVALGLGRLLWVPVIIVVVLI